MLAGVDLTRDVLKGSWKKTPDGLELIEVNGAAVLEFDYLPPPAYDFEIEFTPTGPGLNVNQYIANGGSSFAWKLNSHNRTRPLYGFELLDGKFSKDLPEAATTLNNLKLDVGKRYTSRVEARPGGVRAFVNGEECVTWWGDLRRFSMEGITKLKNDRHLGIGSYNRPAIFHRTTVRAVGESVKVAAAPILERGAIKLWDAPAKIPKDPAIRWEDNALRLDKANITSGPRSRDGIIRASIRANPDANFPHIALRGQSNNSDYRMALFAAEKRIDLIYFDGTKGTLCNNWPLPRTYKPDEWLRLELRAIGDDLAVSLDGQLFGTVHDTSLPEPGHARVSAEGNGYFRDIVYIPLDPPPPAGTNLLPNPSFEKLSADGKPVGWEETVWKGDATWSIGDRSAAHTGEGCLHIVAGSGGVDAGALTKVTVKSGTDYRLSALMKTGNVSGALGAYVTALRSNEDPIDNKPYRLRALTGDSDWTFVEKVFHADADSERTVSCALGGWGFSTGEAWFDNVSLVKISGSQVPSAAYPQPREWKDRTAMIRSYGLETGELVADGEWLTLAPGKEWHPTKPLSSKPTSDVAIRVMFANSVAVPLRQSDDGSYIVKIASDAKIFLYRKGKSNTDLKRGIDLGAGYVAAAEHEMVFAAQGDQLTLWVDGKEVASVRDGTSRTGGMQISFEGNSRIKKVETGELETAPPTPPAAPK